MSVFGDAVADLRALPQQSPGDAPSPQLDVIEGGFDRAARWARLLGTTLLVTFVVGLVGVLAVHATIMQNQRSLDDQRGEIARLAAATESLRHELAALEAPARIVAEARDFGMIDAPVVTYLRVSGGLLEERTIIAAENQLLAG